MLNSAMTALKRNQWTGSFRLTQYLTFPLFLSFAVFRQCTLPLISFLASGGRRHYVLSAAAMSQAGLCPGAVTWVKRHRDIFHRRSNEIETPARLGLARLGSARLGPARPGSARLVSALLVSARPCSARPCSTRLGLSRPGSARLGSARPGPTRPDLTLPGLRSPPQGLM